MDTEEIFDKVVSYNEELERAVLGSLLVDPTRLNEVRDRLAVDDFMVSTHAALYRELLDGRTSPFTVRVNDLSSSDIVAIQESVPKSFSLRDSSDELVNLSDKRLVMQTLRAALLGIEDQDTAQDVIESIIENVKHSVRVARSGGQSMENVVKMAEFFLNTNPDTNQKVKFMSGKQRTLPMMRSVVGDIAQSLNIQALKGEAHV